jgi:hypothetical protein
VNKSLTFAKIFAGNTQKKRVIERRKKCGIRAKKFLIIEMVKLPDVSPQDIQI